MDDFDIDWFKFIVMAERNRAVARFAECHVEIAEMLLSAGFTPSLLVLVAEKKVRDLAEDIAREKAEKAEPTAAGPCPAPEADGDDRAP